MKPEPNTELDKYRMVHPTMGASPKGASYGAFRILMSNCVLSVISSGEEKECPENKGWEHVSVSIGSRTPTWEEMVFVKNLFWQDDETVVQFHPKKSEYVNTHKYCLHLWRNAAECQLPPQEFV